MSVPSELPGDVKSLQAHVLSLRAERGAAAAERDTVDENNRLRAIIRELQRARFGRLRRRQQSSQPIIDALMPWLEARLAEV